MKRKRKPGGNPRDTTKAQPQSRTLKRQRIDLGGGAAGGSPITSSTRSKAQPQPSTSPRGGRAAKTRANQRLDAQARDLAEFRRQMTSSRTRTTSTSPRKPTGIRVSARLRGTVVEDDEWQEVPDEWLTVGDTRKSRTRDPPSGSLLSGKKTMKTGLEGDDSSISELTELSDGGDDVVEVERELDDKPVMDTEVTNPTSADRDTDAEVEDQQDEVGRLVDSPITPLFPHDFVEWETVSITQCRVSHPLTRPNRYA